MAEVKQGDVVVGALGHRKALFGYSGHLPTKLSAGDIVQLLNLGGVIGICDSINPSHGEPFDCKVLGVRARLSVPRPARRRAGARRRAAQARRDALDHDDGVPVVAIAGTCMNSGKTAAACAIVSRFRHNGLIVDAFKSTGVSLRRDILAMEDSGARHISMFSDFGIVTTTSKNAPALTRTLLNELASDRPDVIVFELGDGLLGAYGVEAILRARKSRVAHRDGALRQRSRSGRGAAPSCCARSSASKPTVISGPATDNRSASTSSATARRRRVQCDDERRRARRLLISAVGLDRRASGEIVE